MIHDAIDGYSRLILYLHCANDNTATEYSVRSIFSSYQVIGASLSEPHLNVVHLHTTECMYHMYVCMYVYTEIHKCYVSLVYM